MPKQSQTIAEKVSSYANEAPQKEVGVIGPIRRVAQWDTVRGAVKERHLITDTEMLNGDMVRTDGTNFVRIAPGNPGDVLTMAGGIPTWQIGGNQYTQIQLGNITVTSATPVVLSGSTTTVTVPTGKTYIYFVEVSQRAYLAGQAAGDWSGQSILAFYDGTTLVNTIYMAGRQIGDQYENGDRNTRSSGIIFTMAAGTHTMTLQAQVDQGASANCKVVFEMARFSMFPLGSTG